MVFECKLDAKITDSLSATYVRRVTTYHISLGNLKKTLATSVKIRVINLNDNYPKFNTLFKQIKEKSY